MQNILLKNIYILDKNRSYRCLQLLIFHLVLHVLEVFNVLVSLNFLRICYHRSFKSLSFQDPSENQYLTTSPKLPPHVLSLVRVVS